jgi:hypothetical protein
LILPVRRRCSAAIVAASATFLLSPTAARAADPISPAPPILGVGKPAAALPVDPQILVDKGKRPAFFDPNDLSRSPVLSAKSALIMDADTGQCCGTRTAMPAAFPLRPPRS